MDNYRILREALEHVAGMRVPACKSLCLNNRYRYPGMAKNRRQRIFFCDDA
jgi:hypothetical protein